MGRKVSEIVVSVLIEYIILGLQGDKDTTSLICHSQCQCDLGA